MERVKLAAKEMVRGAENKMPLRIGYNSFLLESTGFLTGHKFSYCFQIFNEAILGQLKCLELTSLQKCKV